jgi:tRNA A37 methylthiotransferase MiaB
VGSVREVLVEASDGEGRARGVSENYLRVELRGPPAALRPGARVRVLVEECEGPVLRGRALD